jgi:hypothetical protein
LSAHYLASNPHDEIGGAENMTARKALEIVLLWGVTFAFIGGLLGTLAPDYYRSIFHGGHSPDFNPLQVGIGLGVTQGLASGVVVALGVLTLLAWRELRTENTGNTDHSARAGRVRRSWVRLALWGVATSIAVIVFSTVAFVVGGIVGQ